jgi:lipopolysaccharide/colanic/teichoic acid biosynthesis glycosyltransferase
MVASGEAVAAGSTLAKRGLDLIGATVLLVLTVPLWVAIAVGIKLTSAGPIFFHQERIGFKGAPFTLLKFRTMHHGVSDAPHRAFITNMILSGITSVDATPADGTFKLAADHRITRLGRLLRRTSLDELPQLLNVLRGEMSLVGPRPAIAYEVANYEPWQRERLHVLPGITGLWQVSGRNRLSYVEMCKLDVDYVRNRTLMQDVRIMLRTPWAMFVDRGGAA